MYFNCRTFYSVLCIPVCSGNSRSQATTSQRTSFIFRYIVFLLAETRLNPDTVYSKMTVFLSWKPLTCCVVLLFHILQFINVFHELHPITALFHYFNPCFILVAVRGYGMCDHMSSLKQKQNCFKVFISFLIELLVEYELFTYFWIEMVWAVQLLKYFKGVFCFGPS